MILEKIFIPYIHEPNSSMTPFLKKYHGFFKAHLYSFQIGSIFVELAEFIGKHGEEEKYREDIIKKIQLVMGFINNKENIKNVLSIEILK